MTDQDPLDDLARAQHRTLEPDVLSYRSPTKRPAFLSTTIFLQILGWFTAVVSLATVVRCIHYFYTTPYNSSSQLAGVDRFLAGLVILASLVYLYFGISYIVYAFTYSHRAAWRAFIASCVVLLLLLAKILILMGSRPHSALNMLLMLAALSLTFATITAMVRIVQTQKAITKNFVARQK